MAVKEYTIVNGTLFNGARDTDGGIWIRIDDEDDHRILASAVAKQVKNTEAAKGTLSALDPNAPHMVDYIIESLNRVLGSVNAARPASAQLTGTPIGDAIAGTDGSKKKQRGRKGAKSSDETAVAGEIQWADEVPTPRPRVGDAFWTALGFANEVPQTINEVVGYDAENGYFVVAPGVSNDRGAIVWHDEWAQWIGVGAQPAKPTELAADQATAAVKEQIAALRAGPAKLERGQFDAVVSVVWHLLHIVGKANDRANQIRSIAEHTDEYRDDGSASELASGIEYDLNQAIATTVEVDSGVRIGDSDPAQTKRPAAKKAAAKKGGGKTAAAAKGGAKRKR